MNANGSGRQGVAVGVWPAVNRAGSSVAITQYASGGQSVIVTTKPNGTGRKIVGNATKQQSAGGPDYAPADRLAWYRVTYNKERTGGSPRRISSSETGHTTRTSRGEARPSSSRFPGRRMERRSSRSAVSGRSSR